MIERDGGRPTRSSVVALAQGLEADAWKAMPLEAREAELEPFVREDERLHVANDGEVFIVLAAVARPRNEEVSSKTLEQLQEDARARKAFAQAEQSLLREAFQRGYALATVDMAPEYVRLEREILAIALDPKATTADRRLALRAYQDWKDRNMGKPVAAVEDVTNKVTPARELMRQGRSRVLPASADWTVADVADGARAELEAGTIIMPDDAE